MTDVTTGLAQYFDKAVETLKAFSVSPEPREETMLAQLLQRAVKVDEPKIVAIARVLQYAGAFNELVRDNTAGMQLATRYNDVNELFTSIREDYKVLQGQLADGEIDWRERGRNAWMSIVRGMPHKRFEKIRDFYLDVNEDLHGQIDRERSIFEAYVDFRMAIKHAETLAYDVLKVQEGKLEEARAALRGVSDTLETARKEKKENAEIGRFEIARDEKLRIAKDEEGVYDLLKQTAENLRNGYNIGEALVGKLNQVHESKTALLTQAITFFETNQHVFTIMDTIYTSSHGLHEGTQTVRAMKEGANKALEDIAQMTDEVQKEALKEAHGPTISADSVKALVESIASFEEERGKMIVEFRALATKNTEEISRIVDEGKKRTIAAIEAYHKQPLEKIADDVLRND